MDKDKKKFIVTTSKQTADMLACFGCQFINYSDGNWTYLNEPKKVDFSLLDSAVLTNKLFI